MSRTPDEVVTPDSAGDYQDAWRAITRWTHEGRSWSGQERNCCYLNLGNAQFANVSTIAGFDFPDDARAIAMTDWDHDGDLDLWISSRTSPQVRFLRNELSDGGRSLQLKLVGVKCNRDAIGARVRLEVDGSDIPQSASVRTGAGYLSQSSRWIHFGLGNKAAESVTVTWPGGKSEVFTIPDDNTAFILKEGSSQAQPWSRDRSSLQIARGTPSSKPALTSSRLEVRPPYPLRELQYTDFAGRPQSASRSNSGFTLLNLWSTSCVACFEELSEWSRANETITAANIHVVAVSIDGLADRDSTAGASRARDFSTRLKLPFAVGMANQTLLDTLQAMNDDLLVSKIPLPLPCSFLFDDQGRLVAIYKGSVGVAQLVTDATTSESPSLAVTPFPGKWQHPPTGIRANAYFQLAKNAANAGQWPQAITYFQNAVDQRPKIAQTHYELGRAQLANQEPTQAMASFQRCLDLNPEFAPAHYQKGDLFLKAGQRSAAAEAYQATLRLAPDFAAAHDKLGILAVMRNQLGEGYRHFRQAVELAPDNGMFRHNLARCLTQRKQYDSAAKEYRRSLQIENSAAAAEELIWILATCPDSTVRNGREAVAVGERFLSSGAPSASQLDRIAAAYAEIGNFQKAVVLAEQAAQLASKHGNTRFANQITTRVQGYRQGRPYRSR